MSSPQVSRVLTKAEVEKRAEAKRKKLEAAQPRCSLVDGTEKQKKEEQRLELEKKKESQARWGLALADSEARAYEDALVHFREEQARIAREGKDVEEWQRAPTERFRRWVEHNVATFEWKRYAEASWKVDATKPTEVNTFISQWNDGDPPTLQQTLLTAQDAYDVCVTLEALAAEAETVTDSERAATYQQIRRKLAELILSKIDESTAEIFNHADRHMSGGGDGEEADDELFVQGSTRDVKVAIWMEYGADPKAVGNLGTLDCAELGMGTVLPSHVVISGAALRLLALPRLLFTSAPKKPADFMPVGGVLVFDWLALPPAPKRVKAWTIRAVPPVQSRSVARIPYTPLAGAKDASISALPVHFAIPGDVLVRMPAAPLVAWFNRESGEWQEDGIGEVVYDAATRQVSFKCMHPAPFALVQPADFDIPFTAWSFHRQAPTRCLLRVMTRTGLEVVIEVADDQCRLVKPDYDEFAVFRTGRFAPKVLLARLASCGVSLIPVVYPKAAPSSEAVEREQATYDMISQFAPGFSVASSRWNSTVFTANQFAFRVSADEKTWHTVLTHPNGCALATVTEEDPIFSHSCSTGCEVHAHLFPCLAASGRFPKSNLEEVTRREPHYTRALQALLALMRPLAFSPPPPS